LSESEKLEQLQNRKAELREESRSLEEEQRNLEQRVKVLEEKIAIEELRNRNKTKREAVDQLKSKIDELERRLEKTTEKPENFEATTETVLEPANGLEPEAIAPEISESMPEDEPEKEIVTVKAFEDQSLAEPEGIEESFRKQHEKKKRRLF